MPLRLFRTLSVLTLAAIGAVSLSPNAHAQTRGRLSSRALPLRLTLNRYRDRPIRSIQTVRYTRPAVYRAPYQPTVRYSRPAVYEAPRSTIYEAPRRMTYNAPVVRQTPSFQSIALGAYFYQNGQCAPGDNGAVSEWKARTGRMPAVWMIFQGWTGWNQFPVQQAQRARQLGGQLLVTWEPWDRRNNDPNWSCAAVAGGYKDAYIRQYARAVKSSRVPVMIRFAHEMNGDWYPWGTAYASSFRRNNSNSPASYVAMWRHVVNVFRQEGATNAAWVWAPNIHFLNGCNSLRDQNSDLSALYPGDNYVNWLGLSIYNDGSRRNWRSFSDLFDGAYSTVTQISSKPLMVAELGVTEVGAPYGSSKAAWISQTLLRDIPARYPRVRLVNWFCRDKTDVGEANYRFDSSAASLQAFRYAVNSPLYSGRLGR